MTNYLKGKSLKLWKITQNATYVIPAEEPTDAAEIGLLETNHRAVAILQASICKTEYDRYVSGGSSDSSDSDSEDETPKKKTDGLCFITDAGINGGICTMALEGDASTDSNDETSDDEVDTSAEQRIANLTKIVHKQNKVLAKLKTDYDKTCAELATLKNAASNPAEPDECEECSIHMISLSKLQTKYSSIVDDRDKLYAELNELRSRSNLLGTCVSCPLLKVDLDNALCRAKLADLEEENKHLRTILGWCSIREPQIGMAIAQIKRVLIFEASSLLPHASFIIVIFAVMMVIFMSYIIGGCVFERA
ncbi:unnamed protein product [Miscanthus lutarioriparius]|uniref:Uncharacterized protein n=1 Tax=Miscanthus lutarioriparius TaxID=422564 RepID=A0A811NZL5_9POAL|nr:unnamed protein product [Miscanthus lutarioriparius]